MTPYTGNKANVAGQTSVQISTPQDGDSFTAANDNLRTSTLADWMDLVKQPFVAAYTFLQALTFNALATFNAGIVVTGTSTIAQSAPTVVSAFTNGCSASSPPPRYWKDSQGVVHMDGAATRPGAANTSAFTLPASFRPVQNTFFTSQDANQTPTVTTVNITTGGLVNCNFIGSNDNVSFDGITFPTF